MPEHSDRILSLDVFRGVTIALMILVNAQGTEFIYPILDHARWNGCTLADLVFPSFLFIVGMTSVISLKKHIAVDAEQGFTIYKNILKRSILLFLFGLFLNAFPFHFDFATLRVYGILQRIAVCYLICSIIYLNTSVKTQILIFGAILLGYWYFITEVSIPGWGNHQLSKEINWVGYVDMMLFSAPHLLFKIFDPEGLLSTIPSVATTLSGLIAGSFLLTSYSKRKKCFWMFLAGLIFLLAGWLWSYSFPINKNLWTSSFVLWTSGISLIVFALCFYIIDISGYTKWSLPFKIFGMNALFIFIFHVLLLKIQSAFTAPLRDGTSDYLRVAIADYFFGGFRPENASLFYALAFLVLNFLVAAFLYKRKIFFKL